MSSRCGENEHTLRIAALASVWGSFSKCGPWTLGSSASNRHQKTRQTKAEAAVWGLRDRRVAWAEQFAPADVVESFVKDIRRIIRADWARSSSDATRIPGVRSSWFPAAAGRQATRFDVASCEAKWCANDVLASVGRAPGGQPTVQLRLQAPPSGDLA
jgi:hypothetical protein